MSTTAQIVIAVWLAFTVAGIIMLSNRYDKLDARITNIEMAKDK